MSIEFLEIPMIFIQWTEKYDPHKTDVDRIKISTPIIRRSYFYSWYTVNRTLVKQNAVYSDIFSYRDNIKAIPPGAQLTPLLCICLRLFRHNLPISSAEEPLLSPQLVSSDEKCGGASAQQSLRGIAFSSLESNQKITSAFESVFLFLSEKVQAILLHTHRRQPRKKGYIPGAREQFLPNRGHIRILLHLRPECQALREFRAVVQMRFYILQY